MLQRRMRRATSTGIAIGITAGDIEVGRETEKEEIAGDIVVDRVSGMVIVSGGGVDRQIVLKGIVEAIFTDIKSDRNWQRHLNSMIPYTHVDSFLK